MDGTSSLRPDKPSAVAFFDVDETLISVKSMFDFYDYFLETRGSGEAERASAIDSIRAELSQLTREEANRRFYSCFAGVSATELAKVGTTWFEVRLQSGTLFHHDVLEALRRHAADGHIVALVSGSFTVCLNPIAGYTGADLTLGTRIEIVDGLYTGRVLEPMIGNQKAREAARIMIESDVDPKCCWAYGDHPSDLELLELVGNPVTVGSHVTMTAHARRNRWPQLLGVTGSVGISSQNCV